MISFQLLLVGLQLDTSIQDLKPERFFLRLEAPVFLTKKANTKPPRLCADFTP